GGHARVGEGMTAARSAELLADRPPARGRTGAGGDFGQGPLSQLAGAVYRHAVLGVCLAVACVPTLLVGAALGRGPGAAPWLVLAQLRSEEHTSELQSRENL